MIKGLIFDLGKVLVDFSHVAMHEGIAQVLGMPVETLLTQLLDNDIQNRYETGLISTDELIQELRDIADCDFDEAALKHSFCQIFTEKQEMTALVEDLKRADYPLTLLSNTNQLHFEWIKSQFKVISLFDHLVLSYEVRAMKPAASIYQIAVEKMGLEPSECLFVDDIEENVTAAQKAGLQGEVFLGKEMLTKSLRDKGVSLDAAR